MLVLGHLICLHWFIPWTEGEKKKQLKVQLGAVLSILALTNSITLFTQLCKHAAPHVT